MARVYAQTAPPVVAPIVTGIIAALGLTLLIRGLLPMALTLEWHLNYTYAVSAFGGLLLIAAACVAYARSAIGAGMGRSLLLGGVAAICLSGLLLLLLRMLLGSLLTSNNGPLGTPEFASSTLLLLAASAIIVIERGFAARLLLGTSSGLIVIVVGELLAAFDPPLLSPILDWRIWLTIPLIWTICAWSARPESAFS